MALVGLNGYASIYGLIVILNLVWVARLSPFALRSVRSKNWSNISIWAFVVGVIATTPWLFYVGSLLSGTINITFFILTPIAALIQNILVWKVDISNRGKSTLVSNITIIIINLFQAIFWFAQWLNINGNDPESSFFLYLFRIPIITFVISQSILFYDFAFLNPWIMLPTPLIWRKINLLNVSWMQLRKGELPVEEVDNKKEPEDKYDLLAKHEEGTQLQRPNNPFEGFWRGAKWFGKFLAILYLIILIFGLIGGINLVSNWSSYADYKDVNYVSQPDQVFGSIMPTLSDKDEVPDNWQDKVTKEINWLEELGVTHARMDLFVQLTDTQEGVDALNWTIEELHSRGFEVILGCFGDSDWVTSADTSIDEINETTSIQANFLAENFNPDMLIIFPEPYGYLWSAVGLTVEPGLWMAYINSAAEHLNNSYPGVDVGTTLVYGSEVATPDSWQLFDLLIASGSLVKAIGIDVYPIVKAHLDDIALLVDKFTSRSNTLAQELWVFEIGISAASFGETIQANFLGESLGYISQFSAIKGVMQYSLVDDPDNMKQLGLISSDGRLKDSFYAFQYAIGQITG
ncbi:MAG: hypothetical protein ACTSYA_08345 [Candidatus Kariarchaeaceae archaeon]